MMHALPMQLGAACLLLIALCAVALPFMRAEQRQRRLRERMAQFAEPYARATVVDVRTTTSSTGGDNGKRVLLGLFTRITAFDPTRQEQYPLRWWLVLPIALLGARLIVALGQTLLGSSALVAVPLVWLGLVRSFYRWCERRRLNTLFVQFPDALAMLVRAVRVGIPISEGIRNVAAESADPTGREFALVVDQIALGVTLEEALHGLAGRNKLPEYGFFATALALQSETGGTVSDTLERLAEVIRKRVALRGHARALASEARTSIGILAALPVFTGGALAVLNPDYISTLVLEPQGRKVFTAAILSLTTGIVAMRTIVNRSLS
jgi:tight adherence protein B